MTLPVFGLMLTVWAAAAIPTVNRTAVAAHLIMPRQLEINNFNGSHLEGTTAYKSDFFSSVREQSTNKSIAVPQEKV